ncbi:MAG: Glu/Leu/Phe/Val dehydrogenase dimerization domain-containing protein [Gemmatimonadota bacterium]
MSSSTSRTGTWQRYAAYLRKPPELTLAWNDAATGARAWLVINSLRGGAAGGGTRMTPGVSPREVTYLAKAMELKFSISGPPIGGAKTGIAFDPHDPRKPAVLERWYRAAMPLLHDRYGTGGDLNIDEVLDVVPAFHRVGLQHPQEGVVRGHLAPDAAGYEAVLHRLQHGAGAPLDAMHRIPGADLAIADVITGYGVAAAVRHLHRQRGSPLDGVRVLLEGFGNVGAAAGLFLTRFGARVVAIRDALNTLVDATGVDDAGMEDLIRRRSGKLLPREDPRVRQEIDGLRFWDEPADVFVCAAISESITRQTLDHLEATGVGVIACGANQPFREARIGSSRVAQYADRRFAVLPDILANCGMARAFSYLMQPDAVADAPPVFTAVDLTIQETLDDAAGRADDERTGLLAATLGLALDRIGA